MDTTDAALLCKALGDPHRLQILQMLADGEKCACKLLEQLEITQPTLSHHMKLLCACGLVAARREGKWSHYSLQRGALRELRLFMDGLCRPAPEEGGGCL